MLGNTLPFSDVRSIKILSEISVEMYNDEVNNIQEASTMGTAPNFVQPLLVTSSLGATDITKCKPPK